MAPLASWFISVQRGVGWNSTCLYVFLVHYKVLPTIRIHDTTPKSVLIVPPPKNETKSNRNSKPQSRETPISGTIILLFVFLM